MTEPDPRGSRDLTAGTAAGTFGIQALVEYGILNSMMRDAGMALQRLGGWAARNWFIVGAILLVLLLAALRPKR